MICLFFSKPLLQQSLNSLQGIFHFQLGRGEPMLHTRLRPHCKEFLEKIAKLYELHVFTFGSRLYAHTIAGKRLNALFPHYWHLLYKSTYFYWYRTPPVIIFWCWVRSSTCIACLCPEEGSVGSCVPAGVLLVDGQASDVSMLCAFKVHVKPVKGLLKDLGQFICQICRYICLF